MIRRSVRLYPKRWRTRYGAEFEAMLEDQPKTPAVLADVVAGAIDAHLSGPTPAGRRPWWRVEPWRLVLIAGGIAWTAGTLMTGILLNLILIRTGVVPPWAHGDLGVNLGYTGMVIAALGCFGLARSLAGDHRVAGLVATGGALAALAAALWKLGDWIEIAGLAQSPPVNVPVAVEGVAWFGGLMIVACAAASTGRLPRLPLLIAAVAATWLAVGYLGQQNGVTMLGLYEDSGFLPLCWLLVGLTAGMAPSRPHMDVAVS